MIRISHTNQLIDPTNQLDTLSTSFVPLLTGDSCHPSQPTPG
jgi:hypothetical protein